MQCLFGIFLINILFFNLFQYKSGQLKGIFNNAEKNTDGRESSICEPLISIPCTQVIFGTLHLFLRIMGLPFHQVNTHFDFNIHDLIL